MTDTHATERIARDAAELSVSGLRAGYGRAADILKGIDLDIARGSITTVIGPNGAGKSTFLKAIAGLVTVRAGEIRLGDRVLSTIPATRRVREGVVLCGQGRTNFAELSVEENLMLAGYTLPRRALHARMAAVRAADPVVDSRWHARVSSLSGGQQQSVEISMALMTEPEVLLLDEPSLGLSPGARTALFERVRDIADGGVTVLIVEQNVKAAAVVSDRLVVLEQGAIALDGTPSGVMADDRLREVYVGGVNTRDHGGDRT
ncbi:branched-chain amino acid ABC transporter ATP-binding protein [Agromyces sp. SYSU T00194]|uniref:branched-chain amino acid ABC transporter ATP-binding protein n=1 Tax=Agromyces chitinivorans TaxID=3158560 RepID=UPI0033941793